MRVLFTGYAPVHFLCFAPLYRMLTGMPDAEVRLAGGFRSKTDDGYAYDDRMFAELGVPAEHVLPMEAMREESFDVLFAANTKVITPRRVRHRVQIFHGISFRNRSIRSANMNCDHYFLAGPYMRRKFAEAGLLPDDDPRGLSIGFMKTDPLLDGSLDRDALLASHGFDGSRPVLLYAPTGQKHCSLETIGPDVLRALADTGAYDVLVKLHDHPHGDPTDWAARLAPLESDHLRIVRDYDVIPQLYVADLLITDASSVSSEYSLLDRPMVFLDVPRLIERSRAKDESMVDTDTWGLRCGTLVERSEDAADAVERSLADPGRLADVRQAMARDMFYNPGRATRAAADWLRQVLHLPVH
jgi:hypothetical protein